MSALRPTGPVPRPATGAHRMLRRVARALPTAGLALLAAGPAAAQVYPVYSVTALPAVSSVTAFNDSGLILGRGFVPCTGLCSQSDVPVLYDTRTATLTTLGGGFGIGPQYDALNARGQVAGSITALDGSGATVRSVVIRQPDGTVTTLAAPVLAAMQTSGLRARGLNAAGQMVLAHTDGLDSLAPLCGNYQAGPAPAPAARIGRPWGRPAPCCAPAASTPAAWWSAPPCRRPPAAARAAASAPRRHCPMARWSICTAACRAPSAVPTR